MQIEQSQQASILDFNEKQFIINCWMWYNKAYECTFHEMLQGLNFSHQKIQEDQPILCESVKNLLAGSNSAVQELVVRVTRDELPLSTNYFIQLNENIRETNPTPILLANLNAYSISSNLDSNDNAEYLMNRMKWVKLKNKSYFTQNEDGFIRTMISKLLKQYQVYDVLTLLNRIAKVLKKDPRQLIQIFIEMSKSLLPEEVKPTKHYFYGACSHFCNICLLYHCSKHFVHSKAKLLNELYDQSEHEDKLFENPYNDLPYLNKHKPNVEALSRITRVQVPKSTYECLNKSQCSKNATLPVPNNLKKFQKQWLDLLIGYGISDICLLAKAIRSGSFQCSCSQIQSYLQEFDPKQSILKSFALRSQPSANRETVPLQNKIKIFDQVVVPCFHEGPCDSSECNCDRCHKFCCCSDLCSKKVWCNCSDCGVFENGRYKCPCRAKRIECDPDRCKCDVRKVQRVGDTNGCKNSEVLRGKRPRLVLGKSLICDGLGVFAGQNILLGNLVGEYKGTIIITSASEIIEQIDQLTQQHYLFVVNSDNQVDGKRMGNKTRFVNHALPPISNCDCQVVLVCGEYRVHMFSKREIKMGEELFFDYSQQFLTDWKKAFDKKSNQFFRRK